MKRINKLNKKAQVNLFIIVGLIMVVLIALASYWYYVSSQAKLSTAVQNERLPDALAPVQSFVLQCLQDVAKNGVVKLGEHAGYIELNTELTNRRFRINEVLPTEADAVTHYGQSIPYWWYLKTPYGCVDCEMSAENIPSVEEMQQQLQKYVVRELPQCINDFTYAQQQGFTVSSSGEMTTQAFIQDENVIVTLIYPLSIVKGTAQSRIERFVVELPVPLKHMYDLANQIVGIEIANQTFERVTMSLVGIYSGIDTNKLPPIADSQETYSTVRWSKSVVTTKLYTLLTSTLPLLQFAHTQGAREISAGDNEYQKGVYRLLYVEGVEPDYPFEVNIIPPVSQEAVHSVITPNEGDSIQPEVKIFKEFFGVLPPQQENLYRFFYDVSYPVIVQIRDPNAFQGKGYSFYTALETNILDNKDMLRWHQGRGTIGQLGQRPSLKIMYRQSVNTTIPSGYDTEKNATSLVTLREATPSLFCQRNQRLTGQYSFSLTSSHVPLEGSLVTFGCGTYDQCLLGTTDSNGTLTTTLPLCEGGWLKAEKEGYTSTIIPLSTKAGENKSISLRLNPTNRLKVSVKTLLTTYFENIPLAQRGSLSAISTAHAQAQSLKTGEKVIITISSNPQTVLDPVITKNILLDAQKPEVEIELVPGRYSITAVLSDEKGIKIPAETRTVGEQTVTTEAIELKPALLGSTALDATTGYWDVDAQQLQKQKLTFYVLMIPPPQKLEDLGALQAAQLLARDYRLFLEPEFS